MRDRKVSYFYFARAHSASLFFRAICVLFSLAFSVSFAAAQSNVDEGLPPGWQQWAADCGKTGQRDACYNEGLRHFWGAEGAPVDKAKAAHYFIIACKYNDIDVCRQAIKITRDEIQHVQLYGKALDAGCLLGELSFCHEAFQFYSGYGKFKKFSAATVKAAFNPNLALAYANAACQKGSVFGCTRLGRAFNADPEQNLKGIKPDSAKSMDGYMQACRLGSKEGCFFAFYASSGEDGAPVNVAVREAAMQIGCDKRSRELCEAGAQTYLMGEKQSSIDEVKGMEFMEKACHLSFTDDVTRNNCGAAAYYLEKHLGESHERTQMSAIFACTKNSAASCVMVGNANRPKSGNLAQAMAESYYKKACKLGHGEACDWAEQYKQAFEKEEAAREKRRQAEAKRKAEAEAREAERRAKKAREQAARRRVTASSCPRASCETRSWGQYLRDERAAARARNDAWHKSGGYSSSSYSNSYTSSGTPATPFGNSARSRRNWNIYNHNLRCGNPTASGC